MKLYAVSPDHTGTDPEGENLDEWFTSYGAALRFARECIKAMEADPEPEFGWVLGMVQITRYTTAERLTVEWLTRALTGRGAWDTVEDLPSLRPRPATREDDEEAI